VKCDLGMVGRARRATPSQACWFTGNRRRSTGRSKPPPMRCAWSLGCSPKSEFGLRMHSSFWKHRLNIRRSEPTRNGSSPPSPGVPRSREPDSAGSGCSRLIKGAVAGPDTWPCDGPNQGTMEMLFSTLVTPGADQAARSASCFSAQDRTVPYSLTAPPSASTVIRRASNSALRC